MTVVPGGMGWVKELGPMFTVNEKGLSVTAVISAGLKAVSRLSQVRETVLLQNRRFVMP
jgi:hypothetical protein